MKLRELRQEKGLRQGTIAQQLGLTQTAYSYYENEKRSPDIATLIKIADYFHTTVDNLIDHNVPYLLDTSILSNEQNELIKFIKNLTPEQCKILLAYGEGLTKNSKS